MPINFAVKAAATAVLMAAQVALGAMKKTEGPRLDDLNTTTADYGSPLEDFWGRRLLAGRPVIWAEPLREKKKKSKTKGGKYAEYKYFGTWAVAICGHSIDAVAAIYLDKRKVYQATEPGPLTSLIISAIDPTADDDTVFIPIDSVKVYTGTQTVPDPRMEAWFDDKFGPNSCSALNGISYIVFKDIPLEKFGNRIPQVDIDAIAFSASHYPFETFTTGNGLTNAVFSPDFTRLVAATGSDFETWDVPTRTLLATVPITVGGGAVIAGGGFIALSTFFGQEVVSVGPEGGESVIVDNSGIPALLGSTWRAGSEVYFTSAGSTTDAYRLGSAVAAIPVGFDVDSYFADLNGDAWAVGNNGSDVHLYNLTTDQTFSVVGPGSGNCYGMANPNGELVIHQQGTAHLLLIDPVAETLLDSAVALSAGESVFRNVPVGASSIWIGFDEYSTLDLSHIRTINPNNWTPSGSIQATVYDPINHAIIMVQTFVPGMTWLYLDRVTSNGVTLGNNEKGPD